MIHHIKHLKSYASESDTMHKINEIIDVVNALVSERNGQDAPEKPTDRDDYRGNVVTINSQ